MKRLLIIFFLLFVFSGNACAIYNPQDVPNNRFGIHILEQSDLPDAARLVNSKGGMWGYITLVIRDDQRNLDQWAPFFKSLRVKRLIPIVRIATHIENASWAKPSKDEVFPWVSFLSELPWPTENRYVVLFNEPNHAKEWGGEINPSEYAQVAEVFIKTLHQKSKEFYVLNSGFDLSASNITGETADALWYWTEMDKEIPGIFKEFDGWTSHSYPNPGFAADPNSNGRTSITGYRFEEQYLADNFGVDKKPVFLTETGWVMGKSGLTEKTIAAYYQAAYENIWTDPNLIAVTPFLLNYPQPLFASFSFLDADGKPREQYNTVANLNKSEGKPKLSLVTLFGKLIKKINEPPQKLTYLPDPLF
ncbi:MAG: hypothetical protein M1450_02300 [Patescibacteria group bacterium]|nr:hypothetical protein [Patescibacteria group bacterium]